MSANLKNLIERTKALAEKDDTEAAMSLANELVERYPNEAKVWSLRGYLHRRHSNYAEAVADLTRAIDINAAQLNTSELDTGGFIAVDLFFNRGADKFALGDDQSAIDDFTKGLDLCDRYQNNDYRETLLFWRAEVLLRLGKKYEALADLARVRDDFSFWTSKLRSKADLVADCHKLPSR